MAVTAESFRWLDILEKEFDKAFVDLDLLIGDLDSDEPEMVYNARQKMASLSSCFAQLTHKAQTIFQSNAKNEGSASGPYLKVPIPGSQDPGPFGPIK